MEISYDPEKNRRNIELRNLPFEDVAYFDFETAILRVDTRKEYGEQRVIAIGYMDERLHVVCYVPTPKGIRVISFRKANQREVKKYEEATTYRQRWRSALP
jgi:uncharacterized DUF497 family protein